MRSRCAASGTRDRRAAPLQRRLGHEREGAHRSARGREDGDVRALEARGPALPRFAAIDHDRDRLRMACRAGAASARRTRRNPHCPARAGCTARDRHWDRRTRRPARPRAPRAAPFTSMPIQKSKGLAGSSQSGRMLRMTAPRSRARSWQARARSRPGDRSRSRRARRSSWPRRRAGRAVAAA